MSEFENEESQESQSSDYPYQSSVDRETEEDINASIDLTISLQLNSFLDGRKFIEFIPKDRIRALLKSNYLVQKWDTEKYSQTRASKNYKNEKEQLVAYLQIYDNDVGGSIVKYKKSGRSKWGRVFPADSLGLTTFRRELRNTLIKDLYYDIDIKNSQPEIVRNICFQNNIDCPKIEQFCADRDAILEEVMTLYNVEKKIAKQLFIRLFFNGTFNGWKMQQKIPFEVKATKFINDLADEINFIANKFKDANPQLFNAIKKVKEETKKELSPDSKPKKENEIGSFFALYLQEYEYRIVSKMLQYLINHTSVMNHPTKQTDLKVGSYEYDGFKVLKQNVDGYDGGLSQFLMDLNQKVIEVTGFNIMFDEKQPDEYYNIDDILPTLKDDVANPDLKTLCDDLEFSFSTPTQIAIFIKDKMIQRRNHFIYLIDDINKDPPQWICWSVDENRWILGYKPLKECINKEIIPFAKKILSAYCDDDVLNSGTENAKLYKRGLKIIEDARITHFEISAGMSNVIKCAELYFNQYATEVSFDLNTNLLGMKNGVFDFTERVFRPYRYNDYITMSTNFDFIPLHPKLRYVKLEYENGKDEPIEVIKTVGGSLEELYATNEKFKIIKHILNTILVDEDLKFYVLQILATGLLGQSNQEFYIFNGSGRNGKGIINGLMRHALGNYYLDGCKNILIESSKGIKSGDHNVSLCELDKRRYVVFRELPKKKVVLQNHSIKHLTGGGIMTSRRPYNPNESIINLHLTLVIEVNDKPDFAEEHQNAEEERLRDVPFFSRFTTENKYVDESKRIFKINTAYNEASFQSSLQNEFLNILISIALDFLDNDKVLNTPDIVKERSAEYSQNTKILHQIFTGLFEVKEEGKKYAKDKDYSLPEIVKIINNSPAWSKVAPEDKKKYEKQDAKKQFFREKGDFYQYYKQGDKELLRNWRLIPKEIDADEVDEDDDDDETK